MKNTEQLCVGGAEIGADQVNKCLPRYGITVSLKSTLNDLTAYKSVEVAKNITVLRILPPMHAITHLTPETPYQSF